MSFDPMLEAAAIERVASALLLGLALAGAVVAAGVMTRALTWGGAIAALIVGTVVFGLGGPAWAILVVVFFVSSSLASRWREEDKLPPTAIMAKGSQRDARQVLANGTVPAILASIHVLFPGSAMLFAAFVGSIAAVTADTWATEIGMLSEAPPVRITDGTPVPRGTSGGVTIIGTIAAFAGGTLIGVAAMLLFSARDAITFGIYDPRMVDFGVEALSLLPLGAVVGVASSAFDSFLGATIQAVYYSDRRERETEHPVGPDGEPNVVIRGKPWVTNDVVNFAAGALGALLAGLMFAIG